MWRFHGPRYKKKNEKESYAKSTLTNAIRSAFTKKENRIKQHIRVPFFSKFIHSSRLVFFLQYKTARLALIIDF